ncbi:clathrin interactor EPSIN 1 [Tanacetum coccineum]
MADFVSPSHVYVVPHQSAIMASYEGQDDIQLMRFTDYFGQAFLPVLQFRWVNLLSVTLPRLQIIPCHIFLRAGVYKTSVEWINKQYTEALRDFFLSYLDNILADLANQQGVTKGSRKGAHTTFSKSQIYEGLSASSTEPTTQNSRDSGNSSNNQNHKTSVASSKKDGFQVKSRVWADSLSRGLIDLNISGPKKVDLTDVGIVGGLSAGTEEKDKGLLNSLYMGRAMGTGSGLGKSIGYSTSATADMDDFFSSLSFQK